MPFDWNDVYAVCLALVCAFAQAGRDKRHMPFDWNDVYAVCLALVCAFAQTGRDKRRWLVCRFDGMSRLPSPYCKWGQGLGIRPKFVKKLLRRVFRDLQIPKHPLDRSKTAAAETNDTNEQALRSWQNELEFG